MGKIIFELETEHAAAITYLLEKIIEIVRNEPSIYVKVIKQVK
jgi:hypothetical protein